MKSEGKRKYEMNETYKVKLDAFEGPLDLLLHLVNKLEIDIYDIPVAEITEQYMEYIHTMQRIELNIASEYLVMAATLLEIKSAMLLPKKEVVEEDEYEEDPREELVQRLIEYRKYKEVAEQLKEKELEENQIYTRPPMQLEEWVTKTPVIKDGVTIYDMLQALGKVLQRKKWREPLETTIHKMEISIEERMEEIVQKVNEEKKHIPFHELFPFPNRSHIVTTFLAILQLLKQNEIDCVQKAHFETIYICKLEGSNP